MMIGVCPPSTVPLVRLFSSNGTLPYGKCPETNAALLLKPVRALPGDVVRISHGNPATVNGIPLPNTIASEKLPAWPDGKYIVKDDEVWVFSSHSERSFDSRYFGPVKIANIQDRAFPLLVVE
jgi:type IV secretory pathway protease TraF